MNKLNAREWKRLPRALGELGWTLTLSPRHIDLDLEPFSTFSTLLPKTHPPQHPSRHSFNLSSFFRVCVFLGLHLGHMEVPRLVVELQLQLPPPQPQEHQIRAAFATYTRVALQHRILHPLSEARHGTCVLMDASQTRFR